MTIKCSAYDYDGYDLLDHKLDSNISQEQYVKDESINSGISPAEWRYIELRGYIFMGCDIPFLKLKKGIQCMNCYSMVYYDKCPNDACYNFYEYCNHTKVDGLEKEFWEAVYKPHPELKEKDANK